MASWLPRPPEFPPVTSESLRKVTTEFDGDHEWGEVPAERPRKDVPEFSQGDPGDEYVDIDPRGSDEWGWTEALGPCGERRVMPIRKFPTGATRDTDTDKLDYEGFFSPAVLRRRAEYMHSHRVQSDGSLRAADNWQKGIPLDEYMRSAWRHFWAFWARHRKCNMAPEESLEDAICALMFNCEGYLFELLKERECTS